MRPRFKSRHRRHMWVEFVVGSLPCSERFFSGYSGFPLSSKTNISKFQFDQESGRRRTTLWMCYLQIFIIIISVISAQFLSISSPRLNNLLKKMRERMLKMAPSFLSSPVQDWPSSKLSGSSCDWEGRECRESSSYLHHPTLDPQESRIGRFSRKLRETFSLQEFLWHKFVLQAKY